MLDQPKTSEYKNKDTYEKSFFYRYCLVLDPKNIALNLFLIKVLKENDFNIKEVNADGNKLLLLSQVSEKRLLIEAQLRKVRRVNTKNKTNKADLPQKVIEQEKRKIFSFLSKDDYVSDKFYDEFYSLLNYKSNSLISNLNKDNTPKISYPKTDERWGLGLFTESEMLYLEKGILTEVDIHYTDEFLKIINNDLNYKNNLDEVNNVLASENRIFFIYEQLHIIKDSFPIHTSNFKESLSEGVFSTRKFSVHRLRNYFGDYAAIYFYWLDHYTKWLSMPALFCVFFYMLRFFYGKAYNYLTTLYALSLVIWAQFYLINWKRKCSELMVYWDNYTEEYDIENFRKQYKGIVRYSPITDKQEVYYPNYKRILKIITGIFFMMPVFFLATFVNICFMNLDGTIAEDTILNIPILNDLSKPGSLFDTNGMLCNFLPILYAQAIAFMNKQFVKVAVYTTERENHKVKSNYENTIILKRYIFEFMDNYMCFFYIAFINQNFASLKSQIKIIYFSNGIRRLALNVILPYILKAPKGRPRDHKIDEFLLNREIDRKLIISQLEANELDIYDDYMELVIEFGFLTLFAESFILAPIAILLLNKLEKFADLWKYKYNVRRPEFIRKRNIGMWQHILLVQSIIAIFTNLSLTMMISNNNAQIEYIRLLLRTSNKLTFRLSFFIIEHGILILLILVWICFSQVSPWVNLFLKRRDHRLKSNKWKALIEGIEDDKTQKSNNSIFEK